MADYHASLSGRIICSYIKLILLGRTMEGDGQRKVCFLHFLKTIMKTYKSLWYVLFTLMLACGAMFTFSSCDDDEEDDNGGSGSGNYTLVGTWKCVSDDADDYLVRTFKKDGTGVEVEYINGKKDNEAQFQYLYEENYVIISYTNNYGDSYMTDQYRIEWKNKDKYNLIDMDMDKETWVRQ